MSDYIKPTSDIFVKYLFGCEENKDLVVSFINAVFEDSDLPFIKEVTLVNPFNYRTFVVDKESIVDIKAIDEKGRHYDIEIHCYGKETLVVRSLYYLAKLYTSQLKNNEDYENLKAAICINIMDFNLFDDIDRIHNCFLLRELYDSEYVLTDHFMIHFIELQKIKTESVKKKLENWIKFFLYEGKGEEEMKILLKDEDIKRSHEVYEKFTEDDELKDMYEARLKWLRLHRSEIKIAREKGREEGKIIGEIIGKILVLQEIKKKSEYTKETLLTFELKQLENILNQLQKA